MATESTPKLNVPQMAALVILMSEAREVSNPEMDAIAGITLTGKDLTALHDAGLVESRKVKRRAWAHVLTEKGWGVCKELHLRERPNRAGSAGGALMVLLAGVSRALEQRRISHAEFFASAEVAAPASAATAVPVPADTDLVSRIRIAYKGLAPAPGSWVGLADLRDALDDVPRPDFDAALRQLGRSSDVHLVPVANLKSLTKRDHDAAVLIGNEANHVLSIEET